MPANLETFLKIPDMFYCLDREIQSRAALFNLCLVNRDFHKAFTPSLYRRMSPTCTSVARLQRQLTNLETNPHLEHVRELCFWIDNGNAACQRIIRRMPRLQRFEWKHRPLTDATVALLYELCKGLNSISADASGIHSDRLPTFAPSDGSLDPSCIGTHSFPSLAKFQNLRELRLWRIDGDMAAMQQTISLLLYNSPTLEILALSIDHNYIVRFHELGSRKSACCDYLARIIDGYKKRGGSPLRLKCLYLGSYVYPCSLHRLQKLTHLKFLEEAHVGYEDIRDSEGYPMFENHSPTSSRPSYSGIDYDAFAPEHCPNLRRFSGQSFEKGVVEFLSKHDAKSAARIALSFCMDWDYPDTALLLRPNPEFPGLPRYFRMMEVRLKECPETKRLMTVGPSGEEEIPLSDLFCGDAGAVQGLVLSFNRNRGEYDAPMDYDVGLEEVLARLPKLNQLSIAFGRRAERDYRDEANHQFDGPEDIIERLARRLVAICGRKLRHISVSDLYWEILWSHNATYRLIALQPEDLDKVELFRSRWLDRQNLRE